LRKNNFTELAPRFRSDLAAPIERIHRNSPAKAEIFEEFVIEAQTKVG